MNRRISRRAFCKAGTHVKGILILNENNFYATAMSNEKAFVLQKLCREDQEMPGTTGLIGNAFLSNGFRKIRIFLSSHCGDGGRFDSMREEVACALEGNGTTPFQVYLWGRNGASTEQAGTRFLSELADCDLVVFVIDNERGVTPGVQKEIDQAIRFNKRCLYYFCSEFSLSPTSLQEQLAGMDGPTYRIVDRWDLITDCIVHDLLEDIFMRYRGWCNGTIISIEEQSESKMEFIDAIDGAQLPKNAIADLPRLLDVMRCILSVRQSEEPPKEGVDKEVAKLAKAAFLDLTIDSFDPSSLVGVVKQIVPTQYGPVIEKRWKANMYYFRGDSASAIEFLNVALKKAQDLNLESWFIDDILIDLRNIDTDLNGMTARWGRYQEQLSSSDREVSFPLLDRAISDAYEKIDENRARDITKSYGVIFHGENIRGMIEPICKAFVIAACFGSLTHVSRIGLHIKSVLLYLCSKYRDSRLNATLLKFSIAQEGQDDIRRTIQAFDELCLDVDDQSAKEVFDFCVNYKALSAVSTRVFAAFEHVGYYMNEIDFAKAAAVFLDKAEKAQINNDGWQPTPKSIFAAMQANVKRLDLSWMIDYCIRALKNENFFWYTESLRFLASAEIEYCELSEKQIRDLVNAIDHIAEADTEDVRTQTYICNALIVLNSQLADGWRVPIDQIAKKTSDECLVYYEAFTGEKSSDTHLEKLVRKSLERIESDNETQGKRGYSLGVNEYQKAIAIFGEMENPQQDLVCRMYKACLKTLQNTVFDISGKVHAREAMCELISKFGVSMLDPEKQAQIILSDKTVLLQGEAFELESKVLLSVWIDVVSLLVGRDSNSAIYTSVARCYESDKFTQANAGTAMKFLIKNVSFDFPSSTMGLIYAYACFLAKSTHFQLKVRGYELLQAFLYKEDFQASAAQVMFDGYISQTPKVKQVIIDSIPQINTFDSDLADELRKMVLCDNATNVVDYLKQAEAGQKLV